MSKIGSFESAESVASLRSSRCANPHLRVNILRSSTEGNCLLTTSPSTRLSPPRLREALFFLARKSHVRKKTPSRMRSWLSSRVYLPCLRLYNRGKTVVGSSSDFVEEQHWGSNFKARPSDSLR